MCSLILSVAQVLVVKVFQWHRWVLSYSGLGRVWSTGVPSKISGRITVDLSCDKTGRR